MDCYKFERGISRTAHCRCLARFDESCSHILALLFKLDAAIRAGFIKKACNSDVAYMWNQEFVKKIKPDKIANIKIHSQKAIDNSKSSEPKTISLSGIHTKPHNDNFDLLLPRISKA